LKHIRGVGRDPSVASNDDLFWLFVHAELQVGKAKCRCRHSSTLTIWYRQKIHCMSLSHLMAALRCVVAIAVIAIMASNGPRMAQRLQSNVATVIVSGVVHS
jgi:hypothetical protein